MFCGFNVSADEAVPIESIRISLLNSTMLVGETQKVSISITPTNAENYEFEYFSSNSEVVTAAIGTIIANSEGTADITVKVKDTDISDTITLTVAKSKDVLVSDIEFNNENIYLERYDEIKIKYDILPSNATNQNVTFESLNTSIATVTSDGIVYGEKTGSTRIKVQSVDGNITKYVYVTVEDDGYYSDNSSDIAVRRVDIFAGEYEVTKTVEIMCSQTKQFTAQIYPDTATDKRIRWKSDDDDLAEDDENGIVTGNKEGATKIYAVARDNGRQDTITIKIIPYVRYPDSITINPEEKAVFETGKMVKFTPVFSPEDTTERAVKWFAYGNGASIDYNGNLSLTDKGKITVKSYTSDYKLSATYEIEVLYNDAHFNQIKEHIGVKPNRSIVIEFDTEVNSNSLADNIFAARDISGNNDHISVSVECYGSRIIITPKENWQSGETYIFIKDGVSDIYGNKLNKNIKYKFIVRGAYNAES